MKILLNKNIRELYLNNNLKAKNIISYLTTQGFTTEKEIEKTSLSELNFEGKKIKNVSLNSDHLTINFKN